MKSAKRIGLIIAALGLVFALAGVTSAQTEEPGLLVDKKICLDPGHGGSDSGAVYDDGTTYLEEADINLDVARGLEALLVANGAEVVMTRTDDSDNSNRDRYNTANEAQATILVSIHTNWVSDSSVDGSYALYFHRDDKALAQTIYDEMLSQLGPTAPDPDNFTDFGLGRYASGVLMKSDMPAAMMEPVFMSNLAEAGRLAATISECSDATDTACRRAQIAQAIHAGILEYFAQGGVNGGGGGGRPCESPPCGKNK